MADDDTIRKPAPVGELERLWGRDLWFGDGDYVVGPSGDWRVVEKEQALKQAIIRRIVTEPGEWTTLPEYGVGAPLYAKARKTPAVIEELKDKIRTQLLREPRIASIEQVDVEVEDWGLRVLVRYFARGQEDRARPLTANVEVS